MSNLLLCYMPNESVVATVMVHVGILWCFSLLSILLSITMNVCI